MDTRTETPDLYDLVIVARAIEACMSPAGVASPAERAHRIRHAVENVEAGIADGADAVDLARSAAMIAMSALMLVDDLGYSSSSAPNAVAGCLASVLPGGTAHLYELLAYAALKRAGLIAEMSP